MRPSSRKVRGQAPLQGTQVAEGVVSANRAGYGFVRTDLLTESVFLPPGEMRELTHGDRVRLEVHSDGQGRYVGSVLKVLERGVSCFLGTLESGGKTLFVRSADQRLGLYCRVVANEAAARAGDWVIARVTRYPAGGAGGEADVVQ